MKWPPVYSIVEISFSVSYPQSVLLTLKHMRTYVHQHPPTHTGVSYLKFSGQHSPGVDVAGVGFNRLIVPQDLGRGGGGHGSQQQAVSHSVAAGEVT